MTKEEITQLRIRAVASLKAKGVKCPMPDQILLEMKMLPAEEKRPENYEKAAQMFNELFDKHGFDSSIFKGL